jgi:hypothetical protein
MSGTLSLLVQTLEYGTGSNHSLRHTGTSQVVFAAPAIAPASAISPNERLGKGDVIYFGIPYEAKRREFTPEIPRRGESMPGKYRDIRGDIQRIEKID